jgi:hypothetical protein
MLTIEVFLELNFSSSSSFLYLFVTFLSIYLSKPLSQALPQHSLGSLFFQFMRLYSLFYAKFFILYEQDKALLKQECVSHIHINYTSYLA